MKLGLNFFFVKKLVFDFPPPNLFFVAKVARKIKVGLFVRIKKKCSKIFQRISILTDLKCPCWFEGVRTDLNQSLIIKMLQGTIQYGALDNQG